MDDTAQVFLGMRLQCAKCHHHPFEKWSQDDYYGFAAFFARVGRKPDMKAQRSGRDAEVDLHAAVRHGLAPQDRRDDGAQRAGCQLVPVAAGDDPRQKLVDWMADPKNPFFARALVNRYWAHFFGRGIVDPLDDMRLTNPPSNPELLDGPGRSVPEERLRPEGPGPDDLHEPGLRAVELPQRDEREGQAELRAALSPADGRRGAAGRDRPGLGRGDAVRRPAGRHPRDRPARRERGLELPRRLRPAQARNLVRMRARDRRQLEPEPHAAQLHRGADQALVTGQPGRAARQGPAARCPEDRRAVLGRPSPRRDQAGNRQRHRPPARNTRQAARQPTKTSSGP